MNNQVPRQPLFSVLIANYNNGKYLMAAIESVRQQTYANWEIILVDDGSDDNSHELYAELDKDERIHIFRNDKNMGCGYTKRRCAELANGEICGFLDPDDALMLNALELETQIHIANAKVSIVYSKVYYCNIDYTIRAYGELPIIKKGETYLDHRSHGPMNFASYKNEFYHKTAGINPNLKAAVDQDLYFRLEEVGEIYLLDEYTYKYVNVGHEHAISASETNYISAWYWNMVARRDAFIRRKKSEEPLVEDFKAYLDAYLENQLRKNEGEQIDRIVKKDLKRLLYEQECIIRSSVYYRFGKFLLEPVKRLCKLLHIKF